MEQAWTTFAGVLGALWAVVGWQNLAFMLGGAWLSDIARRRWPLGFGWVRTGLKLLGAKIRGMFKGSAQE